MAVDTAWDVLIVNATNLSTVAYVPRYEALQISNRMDAAGFGTLQVDFDDPFLATFYAANSSKYPWEGNYAVQVVRSGSVAMTFIIEESEVQYSGDRRLVTMAGRGLAATLEWAVVLPEGWDESDADPDDPSRVTTMGRGFGDTGTEAELEAGTYSVNDPHYPAYGGAAFVHLFKEADTGNAQTANVNYSRAVGSAERAQAVTWPLALSPNLSITADSNDDAWTDTDEYPVDEVNYLFEIPTGITMLDALKQLTAITANAQWRVTPTGLVLFAKTLGTDRTSSVLLTVPNAITSTRQFRRNDLRTNVISSNGFDVERHSGNATLTSTNPNVGYGRREAFIGHDHADGASNLDGAKQALEKIKDPLDEFVFQYVETATTRAWLDFDVSDTVRIEYEAGVYQNRQIVGLAASFSNNGVVTEIAIGDVVDGAIGRIEKKNTTGQFSDQIQLIDFKGSRLPDPPTDLQTDIRQGGPFNSGVSVSWTAPTGWESLISHYEVDVAPTGKRRDGTTDYEGVNITNVSGDNITTGSPMEYDDQSVTLETVGTAVLINGLGRPDGQYQAKVRSVTPAGKTSADSVSATFALETFDVTMMSGHIASGNYAAGSAGWAITAEGAVEFESGKFRGDISGASGTFTDTLSGATISGGTITIGASSSAVFKVDTDGNMWLGHASYGSSAPFRVSNAGQVWATNLTITGTQSSINMNNGRFSVDTSGNVIAKSLTLGDQGYNNSMVMGGAGAVNIVIESTAYAGYEDSTALEWRASDNFTNELCRLVGGEITTGKFGFRLRAGSNNEVRVTSGAGTEGVYLWANETGTDKIKLYAGSVIELYANSGVLITDTNASKSANHLVNDGGDLYWGTTQLGGGGTSDHGSLTGRDDDDHTQYVLVDGTRAITGDLTVGTSNAQILGPASGSHDTGEVSYSFKDDPDTGFYRSNHNTFHAATAGATRMTWAADGNVGIGATPLYPFHVLTSGTAGIAQFESANVGLHVKQQDTGTLSLVGYDRATSGYNALRFRTSSSGNHLYIREGATVQVGVGNLDPQYTLDVTGTLRVTGATTLSSTLTIGASNEGHDVKFWGTSAGAFMLWNESENQLDFSGADIEMTDSSMVTFGNSSDLQIYHRPASGPPSNAEEHSFIQHMGGGDLWIRTLGSGEDLYLNAYDSLYLGTGSAGATRMTINSSGNIAITGTLNATTGPIYVQSQEVWHAGNDGADSGLHADLLDGQHGSYYTNHTTEAIQDIVGAMVAGNTETGITVTYSDIGNNIDFALSSEYIQDIVGAMVSGNTETGITVTYQDVGGTLDFAVDSTSHDHHGTYLRLDITSSQTVQGNVTLDHLYNPTNDTYDIGSTSVRWRDIHVGEVKNVDAIRAPASGGLGLRVNNSSSDSFTIDSSGNITMATAAVKVRIGDNPYPANNLKFEVYHNTASQWAALFNQDHASGYGVLIEGDSASTHPLFKVVSGTTQRFRVCGDGKVSIGGDVSPDYTLDVQGTGRFDSDLSVGGTITGNLAVTHNASTNVNYAVPFLYLEGDSAYIQRDTSLSYNPNTNRFSASGYYAGTSSATSSPFQSTNTNTSYTGTMNQLWCYRTGSNDYFFARWWSGPSNAADSEFKFYGTGWAYADGGWGTPANDYAEYFEWEDGNPSDEDRRGICVTLVGNKIRPAVEGEEIVGVVSAVPGFVGGSQDGQWQDKYLRDDYRSYILEDVEMVRWATGEEGEEDADHSYPVDSVPEGVVVPDDAVQYTSAERIRNPDWDESLEYVARRERKEWSPIGMMGQLRVRKGQPTRSSWIKIQDISDAVEEWLVR